MPLTTLLRQRSIASEGDAQLGSILSATLDAFPVACFVIDTKHQVVHWNRACEVLTGVDARNIIGTKAHSRVFYENHRMIMADLIVSGAADDQVDALYHGKHRPSAVIPGTYEAEDFFPHFGDGGRWLYFSAAPLYDSNGALIGAIETLQDITDRKHAEDALKASEERFKLLSRTDPLTQMFNFRYFHEQLGNEIDRATRYGHPISLLIIDVDHFKQVNDRFGHLEGDRVLRLVAQEISSSKRRPDTAFRYGGDEFAVLMPVTSGSEGELAAIRLVEEWARRPTELSVGGTLGCTLSIGVAQYVPGEAAQEFIRRADAAAYEAKRRGRNCVALAACLLESRERVR